LNSRPEVSERAAPGESKLEVDRRRIRNRMVALQKQIEKVSEERAQQRSVRRSVPVPQVALVGYTNAGKVHPLKCTPQI